MKHKGVLSFLLRDSFIYSVSTILTKALYLVLTPIYTSVFAPQVFGLLSLINSTVFFANNFIVFAMDYAAGRWYFDSEDTEYRKSIFASWFYFQLALTGCVFLLFLLTPGSWLDSVYAFDGVKGLLLFPLLNLFTSIPITILQNYYRLRQDSRKAAGFSIANGVITSVFIIAGIYLFEASIRTILIAQLTGGLIFSVWALLVLRPMLAPKLFHLQRLQEMVRFAAPLVPTGLAFWVLNSGALFFINHYVGKSAAGVYGLAVSLSAMVSIFTSAFSTAWGPFVMNLVRSQQDAPSIIGRIFTLYVLACNLLWFCFALFSKEVLQLLASEAYTSAALIMSILSLNFFVYSYSYFTKLGNDLKKSSRPISLAIILASALSLLLYYLLIPLLGNTGAAIASLIGQSVIPVIVYFPAQRFYRVEYNFISVFLHTALVLAVAFVLLGMTHKGVGFFLLRIFIVVLAALGTYLYMRNDLKQVQALKLN